MTKKKPIKKRALGKGLGALIPEIELDNEENTQEEESFNTHKISSLVANPYQPRLKFNDSEIEELSSSIKEYGILQPVLVRTDPENDSKYQIIAGERRVRAATRAGLKEVPVIVREITDEQMLQISIVENIQRENLNPVEEAKAYRKLIEDFKYTQEQVSAAVGKSRSAIANTLRLLNLPENILDALSDALISGGHAKALLGSKDDNIQNKVFFEILDKKLSVRETEALVKRLNENNIEIKPKQEPPAVFSQMATKLSSLMGARVKVVGKKNNTGKIEINFKNREELERIIEFIDNSGSNRD